MLIGFLADSTDKSEKVLKELENIDDDCDKQGIHFVKTDDKKLAKSYGIDEYPTLVYFEDQIPNMYEGEYRMKVCSSSSAINLYLVIETYTVQEAQGRFFDVGFRRFDE